MKEPFRPIATNLTPVNVVGIPGLALVVIAIALAAQFPEVRSLILATVIGGSAIAWALISRRRRADTHEGGPSDGMLRIYEPVETRAKTSDGPGGSKQILIPVAI